MLGWLPLFLVAGVAGPQADAWVLRGARIEIGDGRVIESGSIVVRGGRIAEVGSNVTAPPGTTVVDASGWTAYPGFIDAYSTAGLKLPAARAQGSPLPDTRNTAPATMWDQNWRGIRADVKAAAHLDMQGPFTDRYRDGLTSVVVSTGDGVLSGTAGLVAYTETPKVLAAEVASEIQFRGGGIGLGEDESAGATQGPGQDPGPPQAPSAAQQATATGYNYPGTALGWLAHTRQVLIRAQEYQAQKPAKPDPSFEGLGLLVMGKVPALVTVQNFRDIGRARRLSEEFGFRPIVNGGFDAYRAIPHLQAMRATAIINLDLTNEPTRTPGTGPDAIPTPVLEERWRTWKERTENAARLHAAGIPLAFRGRLGTQGYLAGVRRLVQWGLPREAALKGLALNPAQAYGAGEWLGTLETGKVANLTVMTGDFVDEKAVVVAVAVDGKWVRVEAAK
jgi:imidazolonepropionase-like amidohydrolase